MNCFFHSASTGIFIEYDKNRNLTFVNRRMISISEKRPVAAAVENKQWSRIIVGGLCFSFASVLGPIWFTLCLSLALLLIDYDHGLLPLCLLIWLFNDISLVLRFDS